MKKLQEVINGFTLWSRGRRGIVYARQLEPTKGLFENGYNDDRALLTPILVGREGEMGRDLDDVLGENEKLKRRVEELQAQADYRRDSDFLALKRRVELLERPWWKRKGDR